MGSSRERRGASYISRTPGAGKRSFLPVEDPVRENRDHNSPTPPAAAETGLPARDQATKTQTGKTRIGKTRIGKTQNTNAQADSHASTSYGSHNDNSRRRSSSGLSLPIILGLIGFIVLIGVFATALYKVYTYSNAKGYEARTEDLKAKQVNAAPLNTDMIEAGILPSTRWITRVDGEYVASHKVRSMLIETSAVDQRNLGIFEKYGLGRLGEAVLHYFVATARGDKDATVLLYQDRALLSGEQQASFEELYRINGGQGHLQLGQYYFQVESLAVTQPYITDPDLYQYTMADLTNPAFPRDFEKAYRFFHIATLCSVPNAFYWRNLAADYGDLQERTQTNLQETAEGELADKVARIGVTRDSFCSGNYLRDRVSRIEPSMIINPVYGDGQSASGSFEMMAVTDLVFNLQKSPEAFEQFLVDHRKTPEQEAVLWSRWPAHQIAKPLVMDPRENSITGTPGRAGRDGSRYFRDNPGGAVPGGNVSALTACRSDANSPECRKATLACGDDARYYFNLGEAAMAIGNITEARENFTLSINTGRTCASEYAVLSSKRLGALNLTCEYSEDSLAQIARGTDASKVIDLRIRQNALKAFGHYRDTVDGRYGPNTREAVSRFQREFGFRETGDLTPLETVYLICGAAEIARDINAYNTLGLMYVLGHGVVQNTDMGLQWLKLAARDGSGDAMYNLALIYGSGIVLGSYQVCDVVENTAQADAWLEEAAGAGHPVAIRLIRRYGTLAPDARWEAITSEIAAANTTINLSVDRCN